MSRFYVWTVVHLIDVVYMCKISRLILTCKENLNFTCSSRERCCQYILAFASVFNLVCVALVKVPTYLQLELVPEKQHIVFPA